MFYNMCPILYVIQVIFYFETLKSQIMINVSDEVKFSAAQKEVHSSPIIKNVPRNLNSI